MFTTTSGRGLADMPSCADLLQVLQLLVVAALVNDPSFVLLVTVALEVGPSGLFHLLGSRTPFRSPWLLGGELELA